MRYAVMIFGAALVLALTGCGKETAVPQTGYTLPPNPSMIQGDCDAMGGVYVYLTYVTCEKVGTGCVVNRPEGIYFNDKLLEVGSCFHEYFSTPQWQKIFTSPKP